MHAAITDDRLSQIGNETGKGRDNVMRSLNMGAMGAALLLCGAAFTTAHAAWEPTRTVEIIVPAGPGGGADQMARTVQGIISKHGLMKQSMVVINKAGGAGGEGFLDVKTARGKIGRASCRERV